MCAMCSISAMFAQSGRDVTVNVDNATVKEVLKSIEAQTSYRFSYREDALANKPNVTIHMAAAPVEKVLAAALKGTNLSFNVISDNTIVISDGKKKDTTAATIKASGTVLDNTGEPIIGATVRQKGTANACSTDADGRFTLTVPADAVLEIHFIGYAPRQLKPAADMTVEMTENAQQLDNVVVTALGIKRSEKALGYAVQKIGGDEMATVKTVDVGTALTGKIAGLNVMNSTEFAEAPSLLLRGEQGLLVIDGVPYQHMTLSDVAVDDIESIDVLKGATASALYGERGGAGVIMVTTKRSGEQGLHVSVNSSSMFQVGHIGMPKNQHGYSSGQGGHYNHYDEVWGDKLDIGREAEQWDPIAKEFRMMPLTSRGKDNYKNFLEPSIVLNNNVSISQTGKYGSVRASLSHVYNKGQYPNTKLNKITYTVSGEMKVDKFTFNGGVTYNQRFYPQNYGTGYGAGGYMYNLLIWTGPDYDVRDFKDYWVEKDVKQNWMYNGWYDNPYFIANEVLRGSNYAVVNAYAFLNYDFTPWLKASFRSGVDHYTERKTCRNAMSANSGWGKSGYYEIERDGGFSINNDLMVSARHRFGDFDVEGIVGYTNFYYRQDMLQSQTVGGLSVPGFYSLAASVNNVQSSSWYKSKEVNSVYARASASWRNMIYVDVTGRNDWSSTLPKDTRSYFYPSVSGSFIASELMKEVSPEILSFWKLRGSWTQTKKDVEIYEINNVYNTTSNAWGGLNSATYPTSIYGSIIKPTATRSFEIGTNVNFLNNRLKVDVAYYSTLKYNLVRDAEISEASGFTGTKVNYHEDLERRGWELALTGVIFNTKNFGWTSTFNWARDRYVYANIDDKYSEKRWWIKKGERADHVVITPWERDHQGNIVHVNGKPKKATEKTVIGYASPDWIWGFINNFRYRDFSLTIGIDGRVGGTGYNWTEQALWNTGAHPDSDNAFRYDEVVNGQKNYIGQGVKVVSGEIKYNVDGTVMSDTRQFAPNDVPVAYSSYITSYYPNSYWAVEQACHDMTFIKLRELSVTYSVPKHICNRLHLQNLEVSLIGQNLLLWTKDFKYSDPDSSKDVTTDATKNLCSPSSRNLGFNIKLNF